PLPTCQSKRRPYRACPVVAARFPTNAEAGRIPANDSRVSGRHGPATLMSCPSSDVPSVRLSGPGLLADPALAFNQHSQLLEGGFLNLTDPLLRDVEQVADLAQRVGLGAAEAEAELEHHLLSRLE